MSARDMFALVEVGPDEIGYDANYDPAAHGGEREGNDQVFGHYPGADYGDAVDAGDVEAEKEALRKIEDYARRNGWWGIAYDICVGQSGTVYAGRGLARSGATSGDVDDDGTHNNDEGEAILFLLSPKAKMSPAMRATAKRLLDAHGGTPVPHKKAGGIATDCPGDDVTAFFADYVAGRLDDGPAPTPKKKPKKKGSKPDTWTETIVENLPLLRKRDDLRRPSDDDRRLQGLLAAAGALDIDQNTHRGRFDGKFGPSTETAVRHFQKREGLGVDGLVGRKTWTALLGG